MDWNELVEQGYPFVTNKSILISVTLYLITVFGIREVMKKREKFELTTIVVLHNFILSAASLYMLLGVGYHLAKIISKSNDIANTLICDTEGVMAKGDHIWWFYIFYASKFYELFDTVIIVLRKKPLIFLHVYHHIITMVLVYVMCSNEVAIRWLPLVANACVHVPMYYYYAISTLGMTVWWKKYITKMQISQFVIDLAGNSTWLIYYFRGDTCSCTINDWFFGQGILLSFLLLFINFFRKTYLAKKNSDNEGENSTSPITSTKNENLKLRRTPKDFDEETRRGD